MRTKRWTYRVYYAGRFVASFTSRKKAREFMEGMTDFDLPFLITPSGCLRKICRLLYSSDRKTQNRISSFS